MARINGSNLLDIFSRATHEEVESFKKLDFRAKFYQTQKFRTVVLDTRTLQGIVCI